MTPRRVALLLVAGLIVIALAVWISSTRHLERVTSAGDLVLPGLESQLNTVSEVVLAKGDGTTTTLKKGPSGWVVGERGYPADSGKVRKLLLDLGSLNVVEEKTRVPANYPALGVQDTKKPQATGTRVDLVTPTKPYALIVGKSSSAKSGFVRVPTSEQSLLAAPLITVDADPKHWLDRTLIDVSQDRVESVDEKPVEGPAYTASRDKKETPDFAVSNIPKGRELTSQAAADGIAGSLATLQLDDAHKAATPPADAKISHALFQTFDGLHVDVAGRKDGTHDLLTFTVSSSDKDTEAEAKTLTDRLQGWEYEIPSYQYDSIFRPMDDLLAKPPEKKDAKTAAPAGKATGKKAGGKAPIAAPQPN